MKVIFYILFALSVSSISAQTVPSNPIELELQKIDSLTFKATIFNKSNQVLCLLTSAFFSLNQSSALPIYIETDQEGIYRLNYIAMNLNFDSALPVYRAECILPYQNLTVTFSILKNHSNKVLLLNYFLMNDFHLKSFKKEILKKNWHKKYTIANYYYSIK